MRVTTTSTNRNFVRGVNSVHSELNKSMNRVSSGAQYTAAAENPLAYYAGKKMDNQYQDTVSKMELIKDLEGRISQQEQGALDIQDLMRKGKSQISYIRNGSNNGEDKTIDTIRSDLLEKAQSMVNDLNAQYEDFYVYGGNDITTAPFTLSADGRTMTYNHVFPGETETTTITFTVTGPEADGKCGFKIGGKVPDNGTIRDFKDEDEALDKIISAMSEQGRIDVGYGTISDRETLLDTYTGGLNLLTGYTSDAVKMGKNLTDADQNKAFRDELLQRLQDNPVALTGKAIATMDKYMADDISKSDFFNNLGEVMDKMTETEHNVSTVYSDLGNKYSLLESTNDRLGDLKLALETQYRDKLGADPYEAITSMYAYQYSYSAALQVGSHLMQSSLFDFLR